MAPILLPSGVVARGKGRYPCLAEWSVARQKDSRGFSDRFVNPHAGSTHAPKHPGDSGAGANPRREAARSVSPTWCSEVTVGLRAYHGRQHGSNESFSSCDDAPRVFFRLSWLGKRGVGTPSGMAALTVTCTEGGHSTIKEREKDKKNQISDQSYHDRRIHTRKNIPFRKAMGCAPRPVLATYIDSSTHG